MLCYSTPLRRVPLLHVHQLWLPEPGARLPFAPGVLPRLVKVHHASEPLAGFAGRWVAQWTLLTDLADLEALEPRLGRTTRYHIRRALDRDGFTVDESTSVGDVVSFHAGHDAENPNAPRVAVMSELSARQGLAIRTARIDGEPVCMHVYVYTASRARLLHSYSTRRQVQGKLDYARVARVNKALHWLDLQWFAGKSVRRYDWGGISRVPGNGIDQFKQQFMGIEQRDWFLDGVVLPRLRAAALRARKDTRR